MAIKGVQTTVNLAPKKAFAGLIAQGDRVTDVMTGVAKDPNGTLKYGDLVYFSGYKGSGTTDANAPVEVKKCVTGQTPDGIVAIEFRSPNNLFSSIPGDSTDKSLIQMDQTVPVLRKGVIWFSAAGAITAGRTAVYDDSAATLISPATAGSGDTTLYGIEFLSGRTDAGLILLEVNLPNYKVTA